MSTGSSADASKNYVDARIVLDPLTKTNVLGENHEITATVQITEDGTNWISAPDGTKVTFTITSGSATFVGTSEPTTTGGLAKVTIKSLTAGTNTIHAETEVTVGTRRSNSRRGEHRKQCRC